MSRSECWSYLSWYHQASGHWATWEPGATVRPGDVGHFDGELRFRHWRTLHDYGIDFRASRDQVTGPSDILLADSKDFYCRTKAAGKTAHGFALLGELEAGVNISARKQRACILQMRGVTESSIADPPGVLKEVAKRIREGEWEIDSVIVMRRLRARGGFAAIFEGPGHDIELKAAGNAHLTGLVDLGGVDLRLAGGRNGSKVRFFEFGDRVTPVISQVIQVKKSLWSKLLPWGTEGLWIIAPDGRRFRAGNLPRDLSTFSAQSRRYSSTQSAMPVEELLAMSVGSLFEEFSATLSEDDASEPTEESLTVAGRAVIPSAVANIRRFVLPLPRVPAALTAANSVDDVPPLLDAMSPDGDIRFTMPDSHGGEFRLEVSVSSTFSLPVVVSVIFRTIGGRDEEVLIPIGDQSSDRACSAVDLPSCDSSVALQSSSVMSLDGVPEWRDGLIRASVRVAATMSTVRAWKRVISLVPQSAAEVIAAELHELGNG